MKDLENEIYKLTEAIEQNTSVRENTYDRIVETRIDFAKDLKQLQCDVKHLCQRLETNQNVVGIFLTGIIIVMLCIMRWWL